VAAAALFRSAADRTPQAVAGADVVLRLELRDIQARIERVEERDFFDEKEVQKPANLSCFYCHQADEYQVRWLVRTKKKALSGRADERDRARFAKARTYMLRRDDFVQCKNPRCRKRFEISSLQSVVFTDN
jgi:hypothetical protein